MIGKGLATTAILALTACVPSIESLAGGDIDEMIAEADLNGDERIDWEEFVQSEEEDGEPPTREEFAEFDRNGDDYIVRDEIKGWIQDKL